jgi:hypothetical protein
MEREKIYLIFKHLKHWWMKEHDEGIKDRWYFIGAATFRGGGGWSSFCGAW